MNISATVNNKLREEIIKILKLYETIKGCAINNLVDESLKDNYMTVSRELREMKKDGIIESKVKIIKGCQIHFYKLCG